MTYNVFSGTLNPTHFTSLPPITLPKTQYFSGFLGIFDPTACIQQGIHQIADDTKHCIHLQHSHPHCTTLGNASAPECLFWQTSLAS